MVVVSTWVLPTTPRGRKVAMPRALRSRSTGRQSTSSQAFTAAGVGRAAGGRRNQWEVAHPVGVGQRNRGAAGHAEPPPPPCAGRAADAHRGSARVPNTAMVGLPPSSSKDRAYSMAGSVPNTERKTFCATPLCAQACQERRRVGGLKKHRAPPPPTERHLRYATYQSLSVTMSLVKGAASSSGGEAAAQLWRRSTAARTSAAVLVELAMAALTKENLRSAVLGRCKPTFSDYTGFFPGGRGL